MKIGFSLFALVVLISMSPSSFAGGDVAAGQEKNTSKGCVDCNGTDGNSPSPSNEPIQPPRLAGQHADYLEKALEDYASGARQSPFMVGFAATLSEQDRADLAAFYASQKGLEIIRYDQ